jgi:hypothetical protein
MSGKTFDLTEIISDLLRRIDEGRKTVRETQNVSDDFRRTYANRDKARQLLNELQSKMVSLDEPAKSQAKAEFDRHMSEFQKLDDESSRLSLQLNETIAFIGPFSKDVLLLAERLPLKPEWDAYRQVVGRLNVCAIWTGRGQVRRFEPFPTPNGAFWKDVSITFISEHRVQIAVLSVTQTRNYAEMGFEDRRGGVGKPDSAWERLKLLAETAGKIERPVDFKRPGWPKVEKQAQAIRAGLRELFSIPGNPLPFRKHIGYEAEFNIKLGNSIEH